MSNIAKVYVYENWKHAIPNKLGTLFVDGGKGKEVISFEYDEDWLANADDKFVFDPDLALFRGRQYTPLDKPSLHEMLRQYMEVADKELSDFYKIDSSKKYVYMYSYLYKGDKSWTQEYETIYGSLEACCDALREDIADMDVTYSPQSTGVLKYRLKKQSLVDTQIVAELEFNGNGDLEGIMRHKPENEEIDKILNYSFEGLWFDFPTPFKKGDIVWVPPCCGQMRYDGGFVLNGLSTWNPAEYMIQSGDNTDMNGCGYFINPDGTVYYEVMSNYMDLEYYNGPYKVNEKILPALSKFVKGEIEIDLLLCVYRKVLLDVVGDDSMLKSWYSKEILEELGVK